MKHLANGVGRQADDYDCNPHHLHLKRGGNRLKRTKTEWNKKLRGPPWLSASQENTKQAPLTTQRWMSTQLSPHAHKTTSNLNERTTSNRRGRSCRDQNPIAVIAPSNKPLPANLMANRIKIRPPTSNRVTNTMKDISLKRKQPTLWTVQEEVRLRAKRAKLRQMYSQAQTHRKGSGLGAVTTAFDPTDDVTATITASGAAASLVASTEDAEPTEPVRWALGLRTPSDRIPRPSLKSTGVFLEAPGS
jgi:hypothetical protein